jgi:hypothetical protein
MRNERGNHSFNKCLLSTYCVPGSSRDLEKKGLGQTGVVPAKDLFSKQVLQSGRSRRPQEVRWLGVWESLRLVPSPSKYGQRRHRMTQPGVHHLLFSTVMHDFLRGPICRWASTLSRKKAGLSLWLKSPEKWLSRRL